MPRTLSTTALQSVLERETGQVWLRLLKIEHADLAEPIRVVADDRDVEHLGETYQKFPFRVRMPTESEEELPTVTLRIDAVDQRIIEAVRSISGAPDVTFFIVLRSSPDTIEAGPLTAKLRNVRAANGVIEGDLFFEDWLAEPFPADSFTPGMFPGLFPQ